LALGKNIFFLWIFLHKLKQYLKEFVRSSETVSELKASLIPPSERITTATLIRSDIKIPSSAITDIVNKLILSFFIESVGMSSVSGFGEGEWFLFGEVGLFEVMKAII
jgi:hypothetical protein